MTSLFEIRFLGGDNNLFSDMKTLLRKNIPSFRQNYLNLQMEEVYNLLRNTGGEILLKEPDVKNNYGGLRGVHLMEWLNFAFKFQSGFPGLKYVLPAEYYERVYESYDFLLYIRNMLHFISGRKKDRLFIEDQFYVSEKMGIEGTKEEKAKRLMKKYYDNSLSIFLNLLYTIEKFHLYFIKGLKGLKKKKKRDFVIYDRRFYVLEDTPLSVEDAFKKIYLCCKFGYDFTFSLINYAKKCCEKLNDENRKSRELFYYFRKILSLKNSFLALNIMKLSDILYEYIKPFNEIKHLVIYNPYHRFTVDEHSLEAVKALEYLYSLKINSTNRLELWHFMQIFSYYKKNLWSIKLALLLHDIGKAYEGDHSKNSVEMADEILSVLPIKHMIKDLILFLIDNHLLLSNISRRRNISDHYLIQDLVERFIITPFPEEYFDALYIFTFCDMYATGNGSFKGYNAELLTLLYKNIFSYLSGKSLKAYSRDYENEIIRSFPGKERREIMGFIKEMGGSYLLQNQKEEITEDYRIIKKIRDDELATRVRSYNDYFRVKIFGVDRKGLFAFFCGVLFLNSADIVKAEVNTFNGIAVDEFIISRIFGVDFMEHMQEELSLWESDLKTLLERYKYNLQELDEEIEIKKKKVKKPFPDFYKKTEVNFIMEENLRYRVEIKGMDRPALLYDIASFLTQNGFEIQRAHIDTLGWYVHDIFEIRSATEMNDFELEGIKNKLIKILV